MFKRTILFFTCLVQLTVYAHVGSSEVLMQGAAGPYKLLVSIKPPGIIPGVARVKVYLQDAGIHSVTFRAVYFRTGNTGAPGADEMKSTGEPGQYAGEVWLMNGGSSSIQVKVQGSLGEGEIIVPIVAVATAKKDLPASTAGLLLALGIFLFTLMVTIAGSSVSDGITEAGQPVPAKRGRIKLGAMVITALFILLVVYGGGLWWQSWADDYAQYLFQPTKATFAVTNKNGANELTLALDTSDNAQRKTLYAYIVPDHGKMMHMFLVRFPAMDAFAHLHPVRVDDATYKTILPALPKGKYLVYADIVYISGFNETIKDTLEIPGNLTDTIKQKDSDDAYAFATPVNTTRAMYNARKTGAADIISCGKPGMGVKLKDSSTMVWEGMNDEPLEVDKLYPLQFSVFTPDKKPAVLQPYMGMAAHAAIIRSDGNVYIHLHPMGTLSMAAETGFEKRIADAQGEYVYPDPQSFRDSVDHYIKYLSGLSDSEKENILVKQMNMPATKSIATNGMAHTNMVEFPYSFPSPGRYRIWVQVKRNGQVLTAAFDAAVQ